MGLKGFKLGDRFIGNRRQDEETFSALKTYLYFMQTQTFIYFFQKALVIAKKSITFASRKGKVR
jgi:hypothetical protein